MKRILLLILLTGCMSISALAQTVKPVTEEDMRYEKTIQVAMDNYEKYMPKATTVEDTIETLYYKGILYWTMDFGSSGYYSTKKAKEYYSEMAGLCKKNYGERSVQYIVALALIDWLGNDQYSYNQRDQRIPALVSSLYPERGNQLNCLMYLANMWSIQLEEYTNMRISMWDGMVDDKALRPLAIGFMDICKAIDPSCYSLSTRCNRIFPKSKRWYYMSDDRIVAGDNVRYLINFDSCRNMFTSGDLVKSACCYINSFIWTPDVSVEVMRPLLTIEIPSRVYASPTRLNLCTAYDAVLLRKGIMMESLKRSSILQKNHKESDYSLLTDVFLAEWNALYMKRISVDDEASRRDINLQIDSLFHEYRDKLNALITVDNDNADFMTITWQKVQQSLESDDIAIEFVHLPEDVGATYYALTLRCGYDHPHLVPLCDEFNLTEHIGKNAFGDDSVYNIIWKPLANEIEGAKNIYFSADGLLHEIPIEYVSDSDGQPFADAVKGKNVCRLSSTRELYLNRKPSDIETAAIYGGIKYSTDTLTMKSIAQKYVEDSISVYYAQNRSVDALRDMTFGYLENTLKEAQVIDSTCHKNHIRTTLYTGADGSETSFKALSGKDNSIIHISTHGFYLEEFAAHDGLTPLSDKYRSNLDYNGNIIDDPMLRSGLLFSGADNILNNVDVPKGVDDGILYSKEVGDLDLHNASLVVLSACQTAQGKVDSEGVFGLQRGFKQAGAGSLLMSLWNVNDEATEMLMEEFYHQLLDMHKSKYDALQIARARLQQSEKFTDPRYWGAFILLDP